MPFGLFCHQLGAFYSFLFCLPHHHQGFSHPEKGGAVPVPRQNREGSMCRIDGINVKIFHRASASYQSRATFDAIRLNLGC